MAFPAHPPRETPAQIGDYQILEKIGDGALGSVYRATQLSTNRVVALKILSPALSADAAYLQRFARIATAAAAVQHPHLAQLYEVGESSGHYYCATEFMPGDSLFRLVRAEGRLLQQTALGVCERIGDALKFAWDTAQLTHGCLRPENIMLDAEGNAKLCDLALAKDWRAESAPDAPPEIFSALNYRAPEVTRPDAPPDPRADIYSMGMTLYFLLTGQVPFEAPSWAEVMARRLSEPLPDPREQAPDTSAFTCLLLERMLAKNPDDRYQTWDDLLRDLHLVYERKQPQAPQLPAGASAMRRTGAKIKVGGSATQPATTSTGSSPKLSIKPSPSAPQPASELKLRIPARDQPTEPSPDHHTTPTQTPKLKLRLPSSPADSTTPNSSTRSLKLPPKLTPLPQPKFPSQPPQPPPAFEMPADQTFSNEPAPAESHHGETAQQFDSTPPSEQWNTQPPPQEPPLTPTTTAPDQPAAEPPPKRSWLLPILGLVFMLAVIGIVPWMIIKLIHKTPTEHVAKDKTEPTNNSDQNKPNDRPKTPEEALRLWSEIEAHQRAFPRGYEKRAQLLRDYIASFPDTPQAAIAQKRLDEIAPWLKSKADRLFEKTMADIYTALTKREYAAALKLAQDAANNAELKDQKPWLELAANAASRLKNFWDALPAAINATKGRAVTLQGISGVIAGATAERVQLELRLGASSSLMEIPLQRLSPQEIADLARAAQPRYDAETRQNYAWFYFAGGMERESSIMFDLAEKAGADIAAGRVLAAMLAKGVEEYAAERELLQLRAALENRQWKHGAELFEQLRQRHSETKTLQAAAEELAAIEGLLAFEVEVLQAAVGAALRSLAGHTAAALAVACSLDGKTAVSVSADGTAKIWDLRAGRLLHTLHGHNGEVRAVAVSPTADYAITGGADRTVRFWNLATGETMAVYAEHTAEINAVAFSHDGNRIASTGADRIIKVLRPPLGVEIRGVKISGETPMRSLALNRDGRFAAAGGDDRNVRQWDLTTGKERRKLQGHTAAVTCIALTADGNIAFSGSEDGTVKQWDFNASTSLRTWRAHEGKVAAIALSADGRFVATAGADGVAKIWEAATGRELRALRGHHGAVLGVALTGDSRFAVTAGEDATVKVWKLWDTDPFGVPILP